MKPELTVIFKRLAVPRPRPRAGAVPPMKHQRAALTALLMLSAPTAHAEGIVYFDLGGLSILILVAVAFVVGFMLLLLRGFIRMFRSAPGTNDSARTVGRDTADGDVDHGVSTRARAEALEQALLDREREDPLVRAKIGAKEVTHRLMEAMRSDRGVHIESLLCAIGSLAGYACQASVRASASQRGIPAQKFMHTVHTVDGARYFFGDLINKPLAEDEYSVWSIAAGAAQQLSGEPLPDVQEIFAHVTQSVGTEQFGRPRLPAGNQPADQPISYATNLWPVFEPVLKQLRLPPEHWPVVFGIAAGDMVEKGKDVIEPMLALRIVMESAVPMSKIDRPGELQVVG